MFISVEVEPNDNCLDLPLQVFQNLGPSKRIAQVKIYQPDGSGKLHLVTGWSSDEGGSPCPAYYSPVEDSGSGVAYLVYGGDWGIRLTPLDLEGEWKIESPHQWGEPCLLLADEADIVVEAD